MSLNITEAFMNEVSTSSIAANIANSAAKKSVKLAAKRLADFLSDSTYFDEVIQAHGITWTWTTLKCGMAVFNGVLSYYKPSATFTIFNNNLFYCNLGHSALTAMWIIRAVNFIYPAVADIGDVEVIGFGRISNVTQINRDGLSLGFLEQENEYGVASDSMGTLGFNGARAFAIFFNDQLAVEEHSQFNATYGIDAINVAGYHMTCLSETLTPQELVALFNDDRKLPFKRGEESRFTCTSYVPDSDQLGAIVPSKKGAALSMTMKKRLQLSKGFNIKTASVEEIEAIEQEAIDEKAEYEAFTEDIEESKQDTSAQSSSNGGIDPILFTRYYKNEDGSVFTSFSTSYVNGYGPPIDYLASI